MAVLAVLLAFISLVISPDKLSAVNVISLLFNPIGGNVVWAVKLPRTLLAVIAGILLSVAGSILQGVFGNRRAASNFIIWFIATAAISLIIALMFDIFYLRLSPDISLWFFGGFSTASWHKLLFVSPLLLLALIVAVFYYRDLNALLMGDDVATTLGIYVKTAKAFLLTSAFILAAGGILLCGLASVALLIIPFFIKLAVGSNYRNLFPVSTLAIVLLTLLADLISRVIVSAEVPAGLILILIGLPFIIYIFWSRRSM